MSRGAELIHQTTIKELGILTHHNKCIEDEMLLRSWGGHSECAK